jgi:hypothetical protein
MWLGLIALALALALGLGLGLGLLGVRVGFGLAALLTEAVFLATLMPLWRRGVLGARDLGLRLVPGARATALAYLGLLAYGYFNVFLRRALHPPPVSSNFAGISHHGRSRSCLRASGPV